MFLIVWDQAKESAPSRGYFEGDLNFEHLPLSYWLDYIRSVSPGSQAIVVQTNFDDGQAVAPPADVAALPNVTFSAKTGHNREVLLAYRKQAFENELSNHQAHAIGIGRWHVKQTLRGYHESDESRPACRATTSHAGSRRFFARLCEEQGGKVSSPAELLRFLHNTGVVYHEPDLFQGKVILDQRRAIEAIYGLFDRKRTYPVLRGKHGRFTLSDLSHLACNDDGFSLDEQRLFVCFMQSCSICIRISGRDEEDPEYIAPELLPARDAVKPDIELRRATADCEDSVQLRVEYRFLHQGTTRQLTARIGALARNNGVYWRDGLIFRAPSRRGVVKISWRHKLNNDPARGELSVQAWGSGHNEMLNMLRTELHRLHTGGTPPHELASVDGQQWIVLAKLSNAALVGKAVTTSCQVIDGAPFRFRD